MSEREKFLAEIKSNIEKYGFHITIVNSHTEPRYAYTIGLYSKFGFELIFAGGVFYMKDEVISIINSIVNKLKDVNLLENPLVLIEDLGEFSLTKVDNSWCEMMLLGAFDFLKLEKINAWQIKPNESFFTLDIPDMSKKWDENTHPVWQWLDKEWDLAIPENSTIVTDIDSLKGNKVTEVMRWEEEEWEMFSTSSDEILKENIRVVPFGTLLGIDNSLYPAINLDIGKGLWRERETDDFEWNDWG